ncbi:MAG: IS66 family transposase [Methanosarcinaceae archaeon]|nr:IS66 family transposase [Methanosarcinaceae archaeon]
MSMVIEKDTLPDDPEVLKEMLADLGNKYSNLEDNYNNLQDNLSNLEEKYRYLQKLFFGARNEKLTPEDIYQMRLFNEAEDSDDGLDDSLNVDDNTLQVKAHSRKKRGRRPLPEDIPREEIIHDLTEEEKRCPCCGKERPYIGEESSEELDIIPAKVVINKHVKKKYGPCDCEDFLHEEIPEVKTAKRSPRLIPGSIASSGLVAYIVTAKFCDALPFYRQSKIFERLEIDISRATLCNWAISAAERCRPLVDFILEEIRSGPLIRMDETPLQVLNEPGRPAESKSYMWVTMGYTAEEKPLLLYQYHPTRSQEVPKDILQDYKGILQTDGYKAYDHVVAKNSMTHVGCFAHVRREFHKAMKASKKGKIGYNGIQYIQKLYAIEKDLRARKDSPDVFVEKRKNAVSPVLEKFYNWLAIQKEQILPQGYAGEAIRYTLNQWEKLIRYTDHHLLTPDNNLVENAIRPFVLGRKNWLFSNTPRGAHASAILFSLIESAKANGLEPYRYLRYIFDRIPAIESDKEMRNLLPDRLSPQIIKLKDG